MSDDKAPEMNFSITYVSKYEYDAEVVDNLNALRVKPAANSRQRVDEFSVRLSPEARLHRHADYCASPPTARPAENSCSRPTRRPGIRCLTS